MTPDQADSTLAPRAPDQQTHKVKQHCHRILVVDDERSVGKAIERLLIRDHVTCVYAESGEAGLAELEKAQDPFSLIITDQRMPGMEGTELLARARTLTPETIRFLITGYSDLETIITAVNQGAVQHYISKPWDSDTLRQIILDGLAMYEKHLESERLLHLAKKQNAKLYELNCELVESAKDLESRKSKLDKEIAELKAQLEETHAPGNANSDRQIAEWLKAGDGDPAARLSALQDHTLATLYRHVADLALRNGIELPEPDRGGNDD